MPRGFKSSGGLDVRIDGANEIERIAKALKAAKPELRKEFGKALREEAKPVVADLKKSVEGLQSKGSHGGGSKARSMVGKKVRTTGTGLRATISRAIRATVTYSGSHAGVRVIVDGRRLPEDQRGLPQAMNLGHWRHPVFGNEENWVEQSVTPKWFSRVVSEHALGMRAALVKVMDDYAKKIERL